MIQTGTGVDRGGAIDVAVIDVAAIETRTSAVFGDCLKAFHAFGELTELAENMRVLSLNAELAAGRAGEKGRAVRALTQYTRELVHRLTVIQQEMGQLRSETYTQSAQALRSLHQLGLLERAAGGLGQYASRATVAPALGSLLRELDGQLGQIAARINQVAGRTTQVAEIINQAGSIATNIAIEATGAGQNEGEFRTVADTMRRYVTDLADMMEAASGAVAQAVDKSRGLRGLGLSSIAKTMDEAA